MQNVRHIEHNMRSIADDEDEWVVQDGGTARGSSAGLSRVVGEAASKSFGGEGTAVCRSVGPSLGGFKDHVQGGARADRSWVVD